MRQSRTFHTLADGPKSGVQLADGIKWITYGQKIDNQDATLGYAQYKDGRTLGEAAGQWITDTQGGKAKVIILGYEKGVWGQQRGSPRDPRGLLNIDCGRSPFPIAA